VINQFSVASVQEGTNMPNLLSRLALLTTIREVELFEFSMLKAMAELLKVEQISMYKLDQSDSKCSQMIYSAQCTLDDIEQRLSKSRSAPGIVNVNDVEEHLPKYREIHTIDVDVPEIIKVAQLWIGITGKPYVSSQDKGYSVVYPVASSDQNKALLSFELPHSLTESEMSVITSLLDIAHNYRNLLSDNQKDKLTGLLNRHTFEESILKIQSLSLNSGSKRNRVWSGKDRRKEQSVLQRYCLAIIDIDNFKQVNDCFGHIIGDEVLLLLSYILKENFRSKDLLFRFGGEEFVVIFRVEDKESANIALDRFREIVAEYRFPQVNTVTVSIGAALIKESNQPATGIMSDADKALYYAKAHGKNQIHFYDDLVECGQLAENKTAGAVDFF